MDNEVLLETKPQYIKFVRLIPNTGWGLLYLLFFDSLSIYIPLLMMKIEGLPVWGIYIAINILFLILSIGFKMFLDRKNYEVTNYKVYNDRIEFKEGFINHKYTTIRMVDIKEIHLVQNFFQRQAELGTIRFITAANNSTNSTGVCFRDIQNSMTVYNKIKQIHENC